MRRDTSFLPTISFVRHHLIYHDCWVSYREPVISPACNTGKTLFLRSIETDTIVIGVAVSAHSSRWGSMSNGILIADDSASTRKVIRDYLTQRNFDVCGEAIDGVDALEKATELEPALILLDLRMPRMNGVEVASVLRGRRPDVRIVLLTMYEEVMVYKSLMSAIGIDAIISKPNGFGDLAECVRGLLGSARIAPEGNVC